MRRRHSINKLEANFSLIVITFFSSLQYIFLSGVPDGIPNSAFVCITSFIGFMLLFLVFYNELFRLDKSHIIQCLILSLQLFVFNYFLLMGSSNLDAVTISCVVSAYFVFIPIIEIIAFRIFPQKNKIISIIVVLTGILFIMNLEVHKLLDKSILFLLIADIAMATYVVFTGYFTSRSNPSILAMGQLLFIAIISFIAWNVEARITGIRISLPSEPMFWGSVIFISVFIRGMYTVVQTYAQRFVSALNTSMIFATEIIITMLTSPIVSEYFGISSEAVNISVNMCIGAVLMVIGILIADPSVLDEFKLKKRVKNV